MQQDGKAKRSVGVAGVFAIAMVIPFAAAAAQDQRACRQIQQACQGAGFVRGGAMEGVGLVVHCVMPIIQGTAQPPRARKPLPQVDPQLVASCKASNPRFGQPRSRESPAQAAPPPPPASAPGAPEDGAPAQGNEGQTAPRAGSPNALRPPSAMPGDVIAVLPPEDRPETGPAKPLPARFRKTMVDYRTTEPAGAIIIDTSHTYLYLVLGKGKALRYGVGVGREGFTWNGAETVTRMAEWPDWHPPEEMIERQPYLPRFMAGGEGNPLGARALYLGKTLYRIHGTNQPSTIGTFVSSGCIRPDQ
jgi:lipoprotein-anchoring transpeptidase ErfK/SrfK